MGLVIVAVGSFWLIPLDNSPMAATKKVRPSTLVRISADRLYGSDAKAASAAYERIVADLGDSKSPKDQDEVAIARMRLGYIAGKEKDFGGARRHFLDAATKYRGSGASLAGYGTIPAQARYQAAVCLAAEGKQVEAKREFVLILKERPASVLIQAAHRRLSTLDDRNSSTYDDLLQKAIQSQEKAVRFELSTCGPKAIQYLLTRIGARPKDYKELAKACGTTDAGTTIEGMRKGLASCGIRSEGLLLSSADFAKLEDPALWLQLDHYVVVLDVKPLEALVYDPKYSGERKISLPVDEHGTFQAAVIKVLDKEGKK